MQMLLNFNATIIEQLTYDFQMMRSKAIADRMRILCWICTSATTQHSKAMHVKATWGRRCDKLVFISEVEDNELPAVKVRSFGSKDGLWVKTIQAFKYIYNEFGNDYDWFLKADDDTYVIMENLRKLLLPYKPQDPEYLGMHMKDIAPQGYATGAAYVLSQEALKRLVTKAFEAKSAECPMLTNLIYEDVLLAQCLNMVGVYPGETRDSNGHYRFFHFDVETYVIGNMTAIGDWYWVRVKWPHNEEHDHRTKHPIAFHHMSPDQIYLMEYFLYNFNIYGVKDLQVVEETTKKDVLLFTERQ
ncbi:glycoprotein-N-acetylgalactosamine 3-beta-galactosyltransferase 1-like [Neocloeon triangulifer]|uniref:glycoprotein-N-acetylgalactosamine 3-beta-galactosyltransferase 1-like n=1 Tax=Neocloeon triangulifer TaxID=2078957 RepID=UPI00286F6084|nr:glycoprotein-N-acetylgalactosamine 3-beta-galactosyltransferase 1-like [Neocloeon triangulifer]